MIVHGMIYININYKFTPSSLNTSIISPILKKTKP